MPKGKKDVEFRTVKAIGTFTADNDVAKITVEVKPQEDDNPEAAKAKVVMIGNEIRQVVNSLFKDNVFNRDLTYKVTRCLRINNEGSSEFFLVGCRIDLFTRDMGVVGLIVSALAAVQGVSAVQPTYEVSDPRSAKQQALQYAYVEAHRILADETGPFTNVDRPNLHLTHYDVKYRRKLLGPGATAGTVWLEHAAKALLTPTTGEPNPGQTRFIARLKATFGAPDSPK